MSELIEWKKALVVQKDRRLGAIPAAFEWMIRHNKIEDVNFETFQDDFNLEANGTGKNTLSSIADEINKKYPHVNIKINNFPTGREKVKFTKELIDKNVPCVMKFPISSKNDATHEMPVVIYDERYMRFIWQVLDVEKPDLLRVEYNDVVNRHIKWEVAREVAWLEPHS